MEKKLRDRNVNKSFEKNKAKNETKKKLWNGAKVTTTIKMTLLGMCVVFEDSRDEEIKNSLISKE